ncbi:hypothetical protein [Rhodococcus tukisamuensis]|uniref:Uncharacterized protein n=1 Tax=Rhodococcus tukisamuensis TaxID=168276 RepID=A0A1G6MLT4_9NOCA|nr:hypothetical protein [Rhodococcus tukisamuensis]SDC56503.1 hypothetical protein SAMN05444580_101230 [Rhodococcus tukisamuensis]
MAADVLSGAGCAHHPVDADAAVEAYAAEIATAGAEFTVRSNLTCLSAALIRATDRHGTANRPIDQPHVFYVPRRSPGAGPGDLVAAFTELGVTALTAQQRLQLAQDLIGTVTGGDDHAQERARAEGRDSILDSFQLIDSLAVAAILAPTSAPTRSVAQKRRKAGDLIGLPIGTRPDYRYPAFQLDTQQHRIHPLVRHANQRLDVENDPYGAASWWLTPTDILDGRSPLEDLEAGDLTEIAIDNILDTARRGM